MRCRRAEDGLCLAEVRVDFLEALEEARHCRGADGNVLADRDVAMAQLAGNDLNPFLGRRVLDPEEVFRERFAEATMDFPWMDSAVRARPLESSAVNPFLDGDVSFGFELEVALFGVVAVITLEGTFDVERVRVVPFDQIAVVTIHRADEVDEGGKQALGQRAAKAGALLRQFQGNVSEVRTVPRAFREKKRFHQRDRFRRGLWPL